MAKRRKKKVAITRRDPGAKRARREQRGKEHGAEEIDRDRDPDSDPDLDPDPDRDPDRDPDPDRESEPEPEHEDESEPEDGHYLPGAAWARPLATLDRKWTWLEARLLFVSLVSLVALLCLWIGIRGMQDRESVAGVTWRALVGMAALGFGSRVLGRRLGMGERARTALTLAAVAIGAATASSWRHVGNDYFQGLLDWLQQGSSIALFGGLAGISTRLTMLVALIGASLACAAGSHINVDVVIRFVPRSYRKGAHVAATAGAALVCLAASYGFADFIAVSGFKAPAEAGLGAKMGAVVHELGDDFFILRKQLVLDAGALPYVLRGKKWNSDERMNGRQWNELLDDGFVQRWGEAKVAAVRAPANALAAPRRPFVVIPDGTASGALLEALNLVFPFGLLVLGLRLLLRIALVVAGYLEPHLEGEGSGDAPAEAQEAA